MAFSINSTIFRAGYLFEKPSYRQAQNIGLSITETSYQSLNKKADELIQSIVDAIKSE
jgi:chromosome partitioning protein